MSEASVGNLPVSPVTLVAVEIGLLVALPPFLFGAVAAVLAGPDATLGGVLLGLAVGYPTAKLRREVYADANLADEDQQVETAGRTGFLVVLTSGAILLSVLTLPAPVAGVLVALFGVVALAGFLVERSQRA